MTINEISGVLKRTHETVDEIVKKLNNQKKVPIAAIIELLILIIDLQATNIQMIYRLEAQNERCSLSSK